LPTFAWEAFSLDHPEDWAPVTITGARKEGYVRIASTGRLSCQVRWKESATVPDLESKLDTYLEKIRADARKAKATIDSHCDAEGDGLSYQYEGFAHGRGRIFFDQTTERVFFLEVTSTKADRLAGPFRGIEGSFRTGDERWAVLGLNVLLPGVLKVERKAFLSGRTQLVLGVRGVTVDAQRWGFGTQLVEKHGLAGWAAAALEMKNAAVLADEHRVALESPGFTPAYGLVQLQPERNQIVTIKVRTRKEQWRPSWDWLS
jgi:hypothetical protein